jgi:hypothetical protein
MAFPSRRSQEEIITPQDSAIRPRALSNKLLPVRRYNQYQHPELSNFTCQLVANIPHPARLL